MPRYSQVHHHSTTTTNNHDDNHNNTNTNSNNSTVQLDPREIHWPGASQHLNSLVDKKLQQEAQDRARAAGGQSHALDRPHNTTTTATTTARTTTHVAEEGDQNIRVVTDNDDDDGNDDHYSSPEYDDDNKSASSTLSPQHHDHHHQEENNNNNRNERGGNRADYRSNHVEYDLSRLHHRSAAAAAAGNATTTAEYGHVNMADLEIGVRGRMEEGLAVAKPVLDDRDGDENDDRDGGGDDDDDDDTAEYFPAAVEYDPDAKPFSRRGRYFKWYAATAVCVIVLVAVGATCAIILTNKAQQANNQAKSTAMSPREQSIQQAVTKLIGAEQLQSNKAFSGALEWIMYHDAMQVTVEDSPNFYQRYIAAYFYFATSVDHPWNTCNPPSTTNNSSSFAEHTTPDMNAALEASCEFQLMLQYDPPKYQTLPWNRWLSPLSECNWAGIACDAQQQIRKMVLNGSNMTGTFPTGIQYLPFLQEFGIGSGKISQTIPPEVAKPLRHLTSFEITANAFTGGIPASFFHDVRTLQLLAVGLNDLKGTIPTLLGNLKDLKYLSMANNRLQGSIPTAIAGPNSLARLYLQNNEIKGTIPTEIGALSGLEFLWLYGNDLYGTLPTEVGLMTELADLSLYFNPHLSGTLPEQLFDLTRIFKFDLYGCNFTGTLSSAVTNLTALNVLRISDNMFYGAVPTVLGSFTNLEAIWIHGNDFTGTMPQQVCNSREALLSELAANCAVDPNTGKAEISCPDTCCTVCCNANGDLCFETAEP